MKILKKSLAALLSVILLATCANLSAVVSVAEASGTRMEAEDQGENINLYGTHNDITWQSGRGIVVTSNADYTKGTLPTYEGLNDGSYTAEDLANTPYIAYKVTAAESGIYQMTVGYMISGGDNASHYMLVYVNGKAYKAPYTSTNPNWAPYSESEIKVSLKAGENTVYCLPFDKTYKDKNGGVFLNQDYLELGAKVSARRQEAENQGENINLYGTHNDITWQSGRGIVVTSNADYTKGTLPTYEGLNDGSYTAEDLANTPYIAYKVTAAESGIYQMTVGYMISGGDNASHYMLVYVNGKAYKAPYTSTNPNWAPYSESEIKVSLKAGENTVYCLPFDKAYKDKNGGAFLNQDYLELGAKVATRMEAEDQGENINLYGNHNDTTWQARGIVVVSNADYTKGTLPTYEGLNNGSYTISQLKNVPYIAYNITVAEAGTYKITAGYMIVGGYVPDHNMLIYANGVAYKAPYTSTNPNWTPYSESEIEVALKAGENTVYCIPFDKSYADSNSGAYLNQDYLELGAKVSARKEAENQGININLYGSHNVTTWQSARGIVVVGDADYTKGALPTYEGLNDGSYTAEDLENTPYIAYNLTVPETGIYRVTVGYMVVNGNNASHNMLVYANDIAYKAPYTSTNSNWAPYSESEVEIGLKAGNNTVYCLPFDKTYKDNNTVSYLNQDYLKLGARVIPGMNADAFETGAYALDPYIAYAVKTEKAGFYAFDLDCSEVLVNGADAYPVTNPSNAVYLALKQGINIIYCKDAERVSAQTGVSLAEGDYVRFGDINDDQKVDVKDLVRMKKHISDDQIEVNADAADLNFDKTINANDLVLLRKQLLNINDVQYLNWLGFKENGSETVWINPQKTISSKTKLSADDILAYCNPVGRLTEYGGAVLMESSASNFTLSGNMEGIVTANIGLTSFGSDEAGLWAVIDGNIENPSYIKLSRGCSQITLAANLTEGFHTIKVINSNDAKNGYILFYSISFTGTPVHSAAAAHKIEFIGDSITAGYGVKDSRTLSYYSYANIAANLLNADHYSVANGGWLFSDTLNLDKSINRIYSMTSIHLKLPDWDFEQWQPEVIVINLGTNDSYYSGGTEAQYMQDATILLEKVRTKNPNAIIIWAYGMMETTRAEWIEAAVNAFNETDLNTHFVMLPQNRNGFGNHPDELGQKIAAEALAEKILELTGWTE